MLKVTIIKGENRRENVRRSLELIADDLRKSIYKRQIVIKPNFVSTTVQLAASHVDQMRGILDFFKDFYQGEIIIAESAAGDTLNAFKNFGYYSLCDEYNVKLIDLNRETYKLITIKDSQEELINVRVSNLLLDKSNYHISAARLKTHDSVVVTLSIKNMTMGSVLLPDKGKVHQGIKQTNLNIAELAWYTWPALSVIDGLVGMEGNGPISGDPVNVGIAIASMDPLAADRVACEIMGIDFMKVGYLYYCAKRELGEANIDKITVAGASIRECTRPFKLHRKVKQQLRWKD